MKIALVQMKVIQSQKDEEHYKKLDETLREMQRMKRELAAMEDMSSKTKVSIWKRIFGGKEKVKPIEIQQ